MKDWQTMTEALAFIWDGLLSPLLLVTLGWFLVVELSEPGGGIRTLAMLGYGVFAIVNAKLDLTLFR